MNEKLNQKIQLFSRNNEKLLKKFWYETPILVKMSSVLLTAKDREADIDQIKKCKKLLKQKVGVLSNIRGNLIVPITVAMSMASDPEMYIDLLSDTYKKLKAGRIPSEFQVMAAMILCDHQNELDISNTIEKLYKVYDIMRQDHPWIVDKSDLSTAALFAMTSNDPASKVEEAQACYEQLNSHFTLAANEVYAMSCILTMSDEPTADKCQKVLDVMAALKERKYNIKLSGYLPLLGGLAISPRSVEEIANEVSELQLALKRTKGFKSLDATKYGRYVFAMILSLISEEHFEAVNETAITTALINVIINEIILTMVIVNSSIQSSSTSK